MKLGFTTIITEKLEESITFYTEVLGCIITKKFESNPGTNIAFLENDGNKIELLQSNLVPPVDNSKSSVSITFLVDNMEETFEFLKEKSVNITVEPMTLPNGLQLCYAKDPNGVNLAFVKELA